MFYFIAAFILFYCIVLHMKPQLNFGCRNIAQIVLIGMLTSLTELRLFGMHCQSSNVAIYIYIKNTQVQSFKVFLFLNSCVL